MEEKTVNYDKAFTAATIFNQLHAGWLNRVEQEAAVDGDNPELDIFEGTIPADVAREIIKEVRVFFEGLPLQDVRFALYPPEVLHPREPHPDFKNLIETLQKQEVEIQHLKSVIADLGEEIFALSGFKKEGQ
jgi:hypothetical protein